MVDMSASGSAAEETEPRRIAGRYRLTEPLGSGAMGTVWAGYDEVLHRAVAIKELRVPPGVPKAEMVTMRERMMREARTLGGLSHPNVITLYDVVDVGGDPYVVMELLPSRNLSEVIGDQGRLGVSQAATVGLAMASALQAAHRAGITHRDVKPGNVLVAHDGRIKLTDFGIARKRDDVTMTQTGLVLGSPAYIAPEVAAGLPVTPAADLWGLGATLFAAVEARPPYDVEGDPVKTVTAVVHDQVPRVGQTGPLADVISGLMIKDPELRLSLVDIKRRLRPLLEDPEDPLFPGAPDAFVPPPDTSRGPIGEAPNAVSRSVASPSVFTPPVRPPAADTGAPDRVVFTTGATSGTSAPRRWTTTNPDGSSAAPLAADPGPLPAPLPSSASTAAPRSYQYKPSQPPPPSRQSGAVPQRPPMSRPMPMPARAGLSGKLVLPLALAGIVASVVGALLGWAGTRSLVGQSVRTTEVVSPARSDDSAASNLSNFNIWVDNAARAQSGALNFSMRVPKLWEDYRAPSIGSPPQTVVHWISLDGARELSVQKISGTKRSPARPAAFTNTAITPFDGKVTNTGDPDQLRYRIDRTGPDGKSSRFSYARLVPSGHDLWVIQLTVPTALAGAEVQSTFELISNSFHPPA
jgi:eukaryotic-like serine/threonine-protein kinase